MFDVGEKVFDTKRECNATVLEVKPDNSEILVQYERILTEYSRLFGWENFGQAWVSPSRLQKVAEANQ